MATSYLDLQGLSYFWQQIDFQLAKKLNVVAKTTAQWAANPNLVSQENVFYIYTDYKTVEKNGTTYNIPAAKLGDGNAYVIDLPFMTVDEETFMNHVNNTTIHITAAERDFWNNKERSYIDPNDTETLVLTKA